ncbi:MAG: cobyric acid synthase [Candidatus Omnitrophota bacterium]|nr:cobyric acid synthase [Candidatus Omnitrophota bacterium]
MPAKALMFQGTSSHVGKSVLTAAFCRILSRRGVRVAPFKGMNMSNNAWVTREGGEMAMAQAVQARACGIEPSVEMNPVLLKTQSDHTSQVVVLGKPVGTIAAAELRNVKERLNLAIEQGLRALQDSYEFLVIEGAGSPAEVNLQETDLANMRVARAANAEVILVADIERGGVFAQLVGTLDLLDPEDRKRVKGLVINKFRGDPSLLTEGVRWLEEKTGKPVFGVMPFLSDLRIPEEDSLADRLAAPAKKPAGSSLRVQIIRTPTMANFTDFDPLHREPGVEIQYLTSAPDGGLPPHLLILPGSKSTMADLAWLRRAGLEAHIAACLKEGTEVLGVCGGFQMMGKMIYDPSHVESSTDSMPGLGLLPTDTLFLSTKITAQVKGIHLESGAPVSGYEIHAGRLQGARRGKAVFRLQERGGAAVDEMDGCRLEGSTVWGTYLHGLFDEPIFRRWFLDHLRDRYDVPKPPPVRRAETDPYDDLADAVSKHLRVDEMLEEAAWTPSP